MKIVLLLARIVMGLMFLVFGLNIFLHFIPTPPPPGLAGQYFGALFLSHYIHFVGIIQIIGGLLLLTNRYVPLALTLLGPVIVNILLFHMLLFPHNLAPPTLVTICWFLLFFHLREHFAGIFTPKTS
jgi:putative oxidoreductase